MTIEKFYSAVNSNPACVMSKLYDGQSLIVTVANYKTLFNSIKEFQLLQMLRTYLWDT